MTKKNKHIYYVIEHCLISTHFVYLSMRCYAHSSMIIIIELQWGKRIVSNHNAIMLRPGTKWPDKGLHQVVHWQYSANLMKSLHAHMHRLALRTWFESGITLYYTFNLSTSRGHDPGVRTSRLVYTCRYLVRNNRVLSNFLKVQPMKVYS